MDSDDDDDMADLFSFGADTPSSSAATGNEAVVATPSSATTKTTPENTTTSTNVSTTNSSELNVNILHDSQGSDDSFLKMLDEQPVLLNEMSNSGANANANANATNETMNDQETQDILNWLEEDDTDADALLAAVADESMQKTHEKQQQQKLAQTAATATSAPTTTTIPLTPPAPVFASLKEALESSEATKLQILEQWEQTEKSTLKDPTLRPLLWCRVIAGKSVQELSSSSLADSFQEFVTNKRKQQNNNNNNNNNVNNEESLERWIRNESAKLAPRVVRANPNGMTVTEAEEALQDILLYHYHSNINSSSNASTTNDNNNDNDNLSETTKQSNDPLLPPVVCAILSAGVPKLASPVLMSHIVPSFMPFVALTPEERSQASKLLHSQFYLLACYHLPMLVYHLDRYVPGWYWPQKYKDGNSSTIGNRNDSANNQKTMDEKENNGNGANTDAATYKGRHLKDQGVIPPSWLMTHLVGECGGTFLDPNRLLQLLDLVFTNDNNSLRFFLVLAVLEQHSDTWLELTGQELLDSLLQHMQDSSAMTMEEWAARARAMKQSTPDSVVDRLRTAEDEAVKQALKERQKRAEAALKARLEAEAAAHREAQERKAEEARNRLTRARLVAFYRRFNPTKEANIDKIMETYAGKYDELDKKLKKKYGVGFNPALNPNKKKKTITEAANESMKKTMQSMNEGIKKMTIAPSTFSKSKTKRKDNPLYDDEETDEIRKREDRVAVSVKVGETLPNICMSREQANEIRRVCLQKDLPMPLRFYLVDSRSEETAELQGRFPTAARLSPETLMDPESLQKYEDSFETVRGTFHICVMGEGHSAIPALYNQKLTPELEEYMREDESRTNNCALFFVKRGFPFVSVLEGGFAAAHAWLVREGAKKGFDVKSLLVDYDPDISLFGQMEKIRMDMKAQAGYTSTQKTQRALQSLLEQSLTTIVRGKMQLEELAAEVEAVTHIGASTGTSKTNEPATTAAKPAGEDTTNIPTGLSSFFGRKQQVAATETTATGEISETPAQADQAPAPPTATGNNQNRFSKWRQAAASAINASDEAVQPSNSQPQQPAPQQGGGNRFGGFGGMLRANSNENTSANSTNKGQPVIRRNPFARFGGGGGGGMGAPKTNTAAAPGTGGASFAGFMKSATTAKAAFGRATSVPTENKQPLHQQQQPPPLAQPTPTIVSLPPRPDETPAEESISFEIDGSEHSEESDQSNPPAVVQRSTTNK